MGGKGGGGKGARVCVCVEGEEGGKNKGMERMREGLKIGNESIKMSFPSSPHKKTTQAEAAIKSHPKPKENNH